MSLLSFIFSCLTTPTDFKYMCKITKKASGISDSNISKDLSRSCQQSVLPAEMDKSIKLSQNDDEENITSCTIFQSGFMNEINIVSCNSIRIQNIPTGAEIGFRQSEPMGSSQTNIFIHTVPRQVSTMLCRLP